MDKKIPIAIIILVVILGIFLDGCSTIKEQNPPKIPDTLPKETVIFVNLGEEFTLVKDQSAIIKELNVSLKIKDFIYSPCPKGLQCVWSGLAVFYELTVDGKIYGASRGDLLSGTPYDVFVKDTDYKTYATFVIDKPENRCISEKGHSSDDCWRRLANRFGNMSYCNKIQWIDSKNACFEDLAISLNNDDLCKYTSSPKSYCLYLNLVDQGSLDQCDNIIKFHWRARCFKEISEKSGEGIDICNTLESDKAEVCREMISGPDY